MHQRDTLLINPIRWSTFSLPFLPRFSEQPVLVSMPFRKKTPFESYRISEKTHYPALGDSDRHYDIVTHDWAMGPAVELSSGYTRQLFWFFNV